MSSTTPPAEARRPWWQPGPFDYSSAELFIMRAAFAVLLFVSIKWETGPYKTQRNPTGLANFFDLTWLAEHPPGAAWQAITLCGLILYVVGRLPALGLAPALSFAVLIGTLITSKAMHHSWQLVTLIALAQWVIYLWPREGWGLGSLLRPSLAVQRLATYASTVVFAASYVVCGLVKLVNSDFKWIAKVPYLSVQLLKSNWSAYYDAVPQAVVPGRLMPPDSPPWLDQTVQAIVDYPNIARVFFGMGLLIELTAFVVLINRRWAFCGGLVIIGMHLSISKVMDLHFEYHILAALIFVVNLPGALLAWRKREG